MINRVEWTKEIEAKAARRDHNKRYAQRRCGHAPRAGAQKATSDA